MLRHRLVVCVGILLGLAPGLRPVAAAATTSAPLDTWVAKSVPIPANDVAYDAGRHKVLAAVPGRQPSLGNELVELDPETGAVGRHVLVGSEPSRIALTDDGTTAYVALSGTNRITRVNLASFTVQDSFSTTADTHFGPRYVEDIDTLPGRNDVVVASLMHPRTTPRHEGVVVFQDGVPLPNRTAEHTGSNRIEVASASTAYGYDSEGDAFGFRTMAIDGMGVTVSSTGPTAISGVDVDIELAEGRIYATSGAVIDPVTRATVGSFAASGLLEVTPANDRITFVSGTTASVFDTATNALVGTRPFPQLVGTNKALVATANGFAVANADAVVLLGPAVGGGPVTLPPAPVPTVGALGGRVIDFSVADLVADAARNLVYASVPDSANNRANEVVAIDPVSGRVVKSVFVGSNPGPLALSGDSSRLHVGLSTAGRIAQIDVSTFSRVGDFPLGTNTFGDLLIAADIEVMPGTADTLAVSRRHPCCIANFEGVAIYDGAVQRPTATTSSSTAANRIEFASPSTLYGTNTQNTAFEFSKLAVSAAGVSVTTVTGQLLPSFETEIEMFGGLIYANTGHVVDPEQGEIVGRFDAAGAVEPGVGTGRAYVLEQNVLNEFDLGTHRLVAKRPLSFTGNPKLLISTSSGLAAVLATGELVIINQAGTSPPTVSSVLPGAGSTAGGSSVSILGSGFGAAEAVSFGGTPATKFTVLSDSEILAVAPPHAAGSSTVTVSNPIGPSPAAAGTSFLYVTPTFVPLPPARLLETRAAAGQIGYAGPKPAAFQVLHLQVTGRGGVPSSGVGAVVLNLTATEATAPGFVTAWPCGPPIPFTSSLNLERPGQTVANLVVVGVGLDGTVCLFTDSSTHLIADVTGWLPAGAGFTAMTPNRLLETRAAAGQVGYTGPKPAAGHVVSLQVTGRAGVPASGVGAVALNLTATEATGAGFVTAWPCGAPRPATSSLNLERAGHTVANLAVVGVGIGGTVCIYSEAGTHLVVDVTGWSAAGSGFSPVVPARLLETRPAAGLVAHTGPKPVANQVLQLQVSGRGGVPLEGAGSVALNLTATEASGAGFVTVWPCETFLPPTSSLNLERPGQTVANAVVVGLSRAGTVCIYTESGTHLIADVTGWFAR